MYSKKYYIFYGLFFSLIVAAILCLALTFAQDVYKRQVREYLKYIVPTMLTFTLASMYSIVDGVFVGHAVGDAGLAGINVEMCIRARC